MPRFDDSLRVRVLQSFGLGDALVFCFGLVPRLLGCVGREERGRANSNYGYEM